MNVNVTYSGYTLADAASCVMMKLPVPDLVWDMDVLWKVWNEPIPAITPEAVPEPAPEPVHRHRGECFAAKPVTYAGKEYPSIAALAKAYHLNYKTCFARLRDGLPLDAPINTHPLPYHGKPVTIDGREYPSVKDASKALGIPYTTLCSRIRKGQDLSAPKYADRCEPITYQGKEYPSVEALSRATGINSRSWLYRIRHNIPLDAPWGKGGNKQEKPAAPEPEAAEPASKPAVKPVVINGKEYQSFHEAEEAERKSREVEKPEPKRSPLDTLTTSGLTKPKPVVYDGKEYESMEALAHEYNRHVSYCYNCIRKGLPIVRKEEKPEAEVEVDEFSLREIRATPADEMKAWQKKWKACRFGGKKYTSLNALADIAEVSLGQAYKGVQKMGKWIAEDEI